jgi:hypothetical protein
MNPPEPSQLMDATCFCNESTRPPPHRLNLNSASCSAVDGLFIPQENGSTMADFDCADWTSWACGSPPHFCGENFSGLPALLECTDFVWHFGIRLFLHAGILVCHRSDLNRLEFYLFAILGLVLLGLAALRVIHILVVEWGSV